ncbi:MLO-like protein 10 isoform X2 [Elaeis guineensis]|uniref:MLO-like protein 10 isoform X2 n=1 Tax=Elaeis guineensis var. tenera TaxID=51953 RepID=UPI003C6DA5CC
MAGGAGGNSRDLDQTSTWAIAAVCAVIILISLLLEKGLHHLGEWLTKKHKMALFEALEKVKAELMILGFISLLLTLGQNWIVKVCIPEKAASTMLPCRLEKEELAAERGERNHGRLLWDALLDSNPKRRILAATSAGSSCSSIRRWKEWEKETSSTYYEFSNDPSRFRFAHETSFVKQHTSFWNRIPILLYIVSFFRQFFRSVRKTDYLAMRHGFINVHLAPGSRFNFQKYIKRSLEDDFKVVVGISPHLWTSAVIVLLLNIHGWQELFWASIIPLIIILAVGTKLQAIITQMAVEIQERHSVIQGTPLVQLSDQHFWFARPQLVLFLIHFTLFQNAFQLAYFFWIWYEFGLKSCFHENFDLIIARICLGVGVQFLCSYITLPLYALVSQMGSHMKKSIFHEQTAKALKKWHQEVKKKHGKGSSHSSPRTPGTSTRSSPNSSPVHQLYRYKTVGHTTLSPKRCFSDREYSDTEFEMSPSSTTSLIPSTKPNCQEDVPARQHIHPEEQRHEEDFSFVKLSDQTGKNP